MTELRWHADDGSRLGTRQLDDESALAPISSFDSLPIRTDEFPGTGATAFLDDVCVAGHEGFDRVVFEFHAGREPSYELVPTDAVRDTSGSVVSVAGDATIRVTMAPASGVDLSGGQPEETYGGPERIRAPATTLVREVVEVEDFESTLTWAIGVAGPTEAAIATTDDPSRRVIELRSA